MAAASLLSIARIVAGGEGELASPSGTHIITGGT